MKAKLLTSADAARLGNLAPRFRELAVSEDWRRAVEQLTYGRHGRVRTYAQRLARLYLSDFDANALTGMYQMLLLPEAAWRSLLGDRASGRLLDVGAGSGDVTAALSP